MRWGMYAQHTLKTCAEQHEEQAERVQRPLAKPLFGLKLGTTAAGTSNEAVKTRQPIRARNLNKWNFLVYKD